MPATRSTTKPHRHSAQQLATIAPYELATCRRALSVEEVASCLNVHKLTVYRLAKQNRIPGVIRLGTCIRFDPRALARHLAIAGDERTIGGAR